ncbi:hypothetical protein ACFX14_046068 [Malus domestica]
MVHSPQPKPCHPSLHVSEPKPCHPCLHASELKPRIRMHHALSSLLTTSSPLSLPSLLPTSSPLPWFSLLSWPSMLPTSSPLQWSSLLPSSNPLSRPSLLSWPNLLLWLSKQPKSAQDYLNHPNLSSSRRHSHHIFHGFDISQLKSRARSLPPFHCPRRRIPSKLFQSKWRTTLFSTSHRVDERPCTIDNLGDSTFATHRDPMCPG